MFAACVKPRSSHETISTRACGVNPSRSTSGVIGQPGRRRSVADAALERGVARAHVVRQSILVLDDGLEDAFVGEAENAGREQPGVRAPSIPTVATGTPRGICTIESSESRPESAASAIGTPITGSGVAAASTPARCAAPPAPAMTTWTPRARQPRAYSTASSGVR